MSSLTIMSWNIQTLGTSKLNKRPGGAELLRLIAKVVHNSKCQIAAFCEMRSQLGGYIGTEVAKHLHALNGTTWAHEATDPKIQLGTGKEQYLFMWNTALVDKSTAHAAAFQLDFQDPATGKLIGFPRQKKSDRPPFLGRFKVSPPGGTAREIRIAVFHAPGPGYQNGVARAAQGMAAVTEFREEGYQCLLVGDFNVKVSTVAVPAPGTQTRGSKAFGPLVARMAPPPGAGPAANAFVQLLDNNQETSLTTYQQAFPGMLRGDCRSAPYDQVFHREVGAAAGAGIEYGIEDLIEDALPVPAGTNTLAAELLALRHKQPALSHLAHYTSVEEAFVDFRRLVSDHLPVVVEIPL
ncbi:hypothetical protein M4578_12635 [Salipiger sp. P9]|uniref:hypothetical protein n=1 Tax=Salipiger pentaromativorans TaxID=2943193 RepID=UPI0021576C2A|nr:hypothetical protein [Salipiger pentaromativorans]MCR8548678.1 hypothetical protein [Salipiger pentaromativorans]